MKKRIFAILISTLLVFQITFIQGFSASAEEGNAPYTVEVYKLDIYDEYQLDCEEEFWAQGNTYVEILPTEYEGEGFTFNEFISTTYLSIEPTGETVFRLYFDRNEYTIRFIIDEVVEEYLLYYEAPINLAVNPTPPEGYRFLGWYTEIPETMPAKNVNIQGAWLINDYPLTFMGYDDEYDSYTLTYGATIIPPAQPPTKAGYAFAGWGDYPETMPAHSVTVESLWNANSYKMTFYLNGSEYEVIEAQHGSQVTAPTVEVEDNYVFSGWTPVVPTTMPVQDTNYYGTYGLEEFLITLPVSAGYVASPLEPGVITASFGGSYSFSVALDEAYDDSQIQVFANSNELTAINGVYTVENITQNIDITVTGVTVNMYTVTFKNEGYDDISYDVAHGEYLSETPQLPEKSGFNINFAHWSIDLIGKPIFKDTVVIATYPASRYIEFIVAGNGAVNYDTTRITQYESIEIAAGHKVTASAEGINSTFLYWVNVSTNKIVCYDLNFTFTVGANMSYKAVFSPNILNGKTVTYLNNAQGIIFSEFVMPGGEYEIPSASILEGFDFIDWDKTYEQVMASSNNEVVSPIYQVQPDVKFVTITNEGGVTGAGAYDAYTVARIAAYGRDFSYWIDGNGEIVSYYASYNFYINYDIELTAVYNEQLPQRRVATRITTYTQNFDNSKLTFFAERSIFSDLDLIQHGIMLTKVEAIGSDETRFVIDPIIEDGEHIIVGTGNNNNENGVYSLTKGKWDYENDTWYARSYAIVEDSNGVQTTHYSSIECVPASPAP